MSLFASVRRISLSSIGPINLSSRAISHCRGFHVSQQHRLAGLDTCYAFTHTALTSLHSFTGLPWSATIPCAAILIRAIVLSPVAISTYRIRERRNLLRPVTLAWLHFIRRKVFKEHSKEGPVACQKVVVKEFGRKKREIEKRNGTQVWKSALPLVQLPVFLVVVETLRKMCGTGVGLLGLFTRSFLKTDQSTLEGQVEDWREPSAGSSEQSIPQAQVDQITAVVPLEQSFATEGAFWFPDLFVPDPLLILPFVLSGSMFLNIYYYSTLSQAGLESKWQRRIENIYKCLALAIGPLTLSVPTGILIYWISSSLCALGNAIALRWYFRPAPLFKPCKPRWKQVKGTQLR